MILVIGDVHFKHTQPYLKKTIQFFEWLYKTYPEAIIIQTGDFFDTASPHSEMVMDIALTHLLKFKEVHIVSGNHELSNRVGNPLVPLNKFDKIHIYTKPEKVVIEGLNFIMLPFLYNIKEMKEQYEVMTDKCDYVVSHIAYPGTNFGSPDEINLSSIEANKYFYGHIHEPMDKGDHIIVGVPVSTRHGEHVWKKRLFTINKDIVNETIIPNFLNFETLEFGEEPKDIESILNIKNAPSVKAVLDKYKGLHIRPQGISLIGEVEVVNYNQQKEFLNFSLEKNFEEFSKDMEVRTPVKEKIQELFTKIA